MLVEFNQNLILQPKFTQNVNAGDPIIGAYSSSRIGHFQARARQLTSQAFERALHRDKITAVLPAVFYFWAAFEKETKVWSGRIGLAGLSRCCL